MYYYCFWMQWYSNYYCVNLITGGAMLRISYHDQPLLQYFEGSWILKEPVVRRRSEEVKNKKGLKESQCLGVSRVGTDLSEVVPSATIQRLPRHASRCFLQECCSLGLANQSASTPIFYSATAAKVGGYDGTENHKGWRCLHDLRVAEKGQDARRGRLRG